MKNIMTFVILAIAFIGLVGGIGYTIIWRCLSHCRRCGSAWVPCLYTG